MSEKKRRERPAFNKDIAEAITKHYENVKTKRPMAYALMSPNPLIEVAYAAGIQPAFPENYACICAARHVSSGYCEKAETYAYSPDICSYCRNYLGYMKSTIEDAPMGGIGKPDLLLMTSCACTHYFKWWDLIHQQSNIPLIFVNTPRVMNPEAEPDFYTDFAIRELEQAIEEIEKVLKIKVSDEKLTEVVRLSDELVYYWQGVLELQKTVPCPLNLIDLSNALFVLIVLAGTEEGTDLMRRVYNETKQRVEEGKGILSKDEEKHRLLWLNIPFWYKLGIFGYFEDRGCVFPFSDYMQYIWGTTRMDASNPMRSLARKALEGELNTSVDDQINKLLRDIKEYNIDGVIAHSNRSCRILSVGILDALEIIRREADIPTLVLDADHTDERVYSEAEIMNRINTFLEMLG